MNIYSHREYPEYLKSGKLSREAGGKYFMKGINTYEKSGVTEPKNFALLFFLAPLSLCLTL